MNFSNTLQHPKTTLAGLFLALTVAAPILSGFDWSHPTTQSIIGLVLAVAIAVVGAMLKDPKANPNVTPGVFLLMLLIPTCVAAQSSSQDAVPAVPPFTTVNQGLTADVTNLYGAGLSYNVGGSPALAGTGLYARKLTDSNLYAFTAIDALPNTLKPFTVTTNIGAGVAQKVVTIGKVPVYIPTAAGISFNGTNTGWQWNTGALAAIKLKGNYFLLPTVRLVKSSVSNGSGYQPIVGVLFGWGQ
jgi:hypothetical protein